MGPLWRQVETTSPAPQSRWPWTWALDDAVCNTYGPHLGLVGRWWSGQPKRVLAGMDGLLVVVVMGDGQVVVPVDCAIRRPDPGGAGAPCRDQLSWTRTRLDERLAALRRRGRALPPPILVGDRWLGDSKLLRHGSQQPHGTLRVEGQQSYPLRFVDGRQVTGPDLIEAEIWPWREHPWEPRVRSVRLRAPSPTDGNVTVVMVDEPGQDRVSLLGLETTLSAPQLIRRWRRRTWIAFVLRTLTQLLATEACQVPSEDA